MSCSRFFVILYDLHTAYSIQWTCIKLCITRVKQNRGSSCSNCQCLTQKVFRVKTDEKLQIKSIIQNKTKHRKRKKTHRKLKVAAFVGHVPLLLKLYGTCAFTGSALLRLFLSPAVLWMDFLHLKNHFTTSNGMTNKNIHKITSLNEIEKEIENTKWQTQIKM